jgi:hypothetical protein
MCHYEGVTRTQRALLHVLIHFAIPISNAHRRQFLLSMYEIFYDPIASPPDCSFS